jgi:hypothetical protein
MKLLNLFPIAAPFLAAVSAYQCNSRVNSGSFNIVGDGNGSGAYEEEYIDYSDAREILQDYRGVQNMKIKTGELSNPRIIFIVDSTGSMKNIRDDIINQFNAGLRELQSVSKKTRKNSRNFKEALVPSFTFVRFAQKLNIIEHNDISDMDPLTSSDYNPMGQTALFDAVGCTLDAYKEEEGNIVMVISDGKDNASQVFNSNTVKSMVWDLEQNKKWSVEMFGFEMAAKQVAKKIGISKAQRMPRTRYGAKKAFKSISDHVKKDLAASKKHHRQQNMKALKRAQRGGRH